MTENEIITEYGKKCTGCLRNTLQYEYEWSCLACGCNIFGKNTELSKNSKKKTNCNNRLNYAEKRFHVFV